MKKETRIQHAKHEHDSNNTDNQDAHDGDISVFKAIAHELYSGGFVSNVIVTLIFVFISIGAPELMPTPTRTTRIVSLAFGFTLAIWTIATIAIVRGPQSKPPQAGQQSGKVEGDTPGTPPEIFLQPSHQN